MRLADAFRSFAGSLRPLYTESEASVIAGLVFEQVTGFRRLDMITRGDAQLSEADAAKLHAMHEELLRARPVQYVLGEAWFCGLCFAVSEAVLIPRPETEELVQWIADDLPLHFPGGGGTPAPVVLDVGTGSGCIAISLKKRRTAARLLAIDISPAALEIAAQNAARQGTDVAFSVADILDPAVTAGFPRLDVIVSNPPYIPRAERREMQAQVTRFEPETALFVPDDDPLVYYRALLDVASHCFRETGYLYVEVHEDFADETAGLFRQAGVRELALRKDLQDRPRMIRATFHR